MVGLGGILLSLISLWEKSDRLHVWGTVLMLIGLIPYLAFTIRGIPQVTFYHPITHFLGPLFSIQSFLILFRYFCKK